MAQLNGAADGAFQSLCRNSVRTSWSYEIVTAEEQKDTGGVAESNILDLPRRRKRSKRVQEATDTEVMVDKQTNQTAVAADISSVQMNAVTVLDAGGLPAGIAKNSDVASIMGVKKRDSDLKRGPGHAAEKLLHGPIRGQQLQPAFSPLDYLRCPQTGTSNITQAVSHGSASDGTGSNSSIATAPRQTQEVKSTPEGNFWNKNHVALPPSHGPQNLFTTSLSHGSCPHGFESVLNSSTLGVLESVQTPHPSQWALNDISASSISLHSNRSIHHARYTKEAGEKALGSPKILVPRQSVLNNEPTPSLLDTDVSAMLPI
jgi:hypothetical protein